jgi:hypothetical protein
VNTGALAAIMQIEKTSSLLINRCLILIGGSIAMASISEPIHSDLLTTFELIHNICGFDCTQPQLEDQNADYGAYVFQVNSKLIRFRVAKITPKKNGQFVTLWQRNEHGISQPFDESEPVNYFVICARNGNNLGQFVFPKDVLLSRDIISIQGKGGKRAIRVYPIWDTPESKQAQKTQEWQLEYFLDLPTNKPINKDRASLLYRFINSQK